jgi:hypothetical protein
MECTLAWSGRKLTGPWRVLPGTVDVVREFRSWWAKGKETGMSLTVLSKRGAAMQAALFHARKRRFTRLQMAPENNILFHHNATSAVGTATTSLEALRTVTIPGNIVPPNGEIRITAHYSMTNSANNKTISMKFGGVTVMSQVFTTATNNRFQFALALRNSRASQVGGQGTGGWGTSTSAVQNRTIDMTQNQDVVFEATKASAGETLQLEYSMIELINFDAHTNRDWSLKPR